MPETSPPGAATEAALAAESVSAGAGHRLAEKVLVPLAALFVLVILVFYVFYDRGRVEGPSMLPTLHNSDMVLLTKGYSRPTRGDVVFTTVDEGGVPVEVVKRVIALPGDTIEVRQDIAFVNGVREPARGQHVDPSNAVDVGAYEVPAGHIYVMGDNRPDSLDSRYMGPVPVSGVQGRVVAIYAPVNRVGRVR